jgi:hypothetical protein
VLGASWPPPGGPGAAAKAASTPQKQPPLDGRDAGDREPGTRGVSGEDDGCPTGTWQVELGLELGIAPSFVFPVMTSAPLVVLTLSPKSIPLSSVKQLMIARKNGLELEHRLR